MKTFIALILTALVGTAAFAAPGGAGLPGKPGALVLDVRTAQEFAAGHIPGAVLLPYDQIRARAAELAKLAGPAGKERPLAVYCRSGRRSAIAVAELRKLGYRDIADFGAIGNWKGPLER